jgi:flagella basal body P-ring formation protein FlgA
MRTVAREGDPIRDARCGETCVSSLRAFAAVVFVALALPFGASAQAHFVARESDAVAAPASVSADSDALVREAIAGRWGVDAARVRIEWATPDALPEAAAGIRLLGSGADANWVVSFEGDDGSVLARHRVRAGVELSVPVAARDLERAVMLVEADVRYDTMLQWGPPPRSTGVAPYGWETRRRITAGEPLRAPAVAPPTLVRPGDDVRITFVRGGIAISLAGRAAGSGALGERVSVRATTGARLEGVITGTGTVRVEAATERSR